VGAPLQRDDQAAGSDDVQYRTLRLHNGATDTDTAGVVGAAALRVVGRFDPERLPGSNPLSRVPLETYQPPEAEAADAAARAALGGRPLRPTTNIGGYLAQPPLLLTTIQALDALTDPTAYSAATPAAPISVIRIRVAGVTGPDKVSRERIRRVAAAIVARTGLAVDVTAGSSPRSLLVELPAGRDGQPALTVREGWVAKGAAIVILAALLTCACFVPTARSRRCGRAGPRSARCAAWAGRRAGSSRWCSASWPRSAWPPGSSACSSPCRSPASCTCGWPPARPPWSSRSPCG